MVTPWSDGQEAEPAVFLGAERVASVVLFGMLRFWGCLDGRT